MSRDATRTAARNGLDVSVITVSNRPFNVLQNCNLSVRAQEYGGEIEHVIVIDDVGQLDVDSVAELERLGTTRVVLVPRPHVDPSGYSAGHRGSVYPRLARLLNIGIANAAGDYVAFLDDDNRFEPCHIQSLHNCLRQNRLRAVHSIRSMWHDGKPYLEPYFPGAASPEEGRRLHALMCKRGVMEPGSNICADRLDKHATAEINSTVMSDADPVFLIDQNLWLIERSLLRRIPIPEEFSDEEIANNTCPDDKLLAELVRHQVAITSTGLPTVQYNLGGISNEAYIGG